MQMVFSIYRYDPEKDAAPYMQDYSIDISSLSGKMLLDVLLALKVQDPSLTFRRSCREGVCGSDGMNINGKNGLACITPLSSLKQPVVVRPLTGFPVIKDLVVDMSTFFEQYNEVGPYLQNSALPPVGERLQSPQEREKLDGLYECILCGCCSSACPSVWWNPESFIGPAGLLWAYRFIADSRDDATEKRLDKLGEDPFKVFRCRSIMSCTSVCPKGLNPTKAIAGIRGEMLKGEG